MTHDFPRRTFLKISAAALATSASAAPVEPARRPLTQFQIACMTLPYAPFPFQRALTGLRAAGYRYVAWGTTHREDGGATVPVLAADATPARAT